VIAATALHRAAAHTDHEGVRLGRSGARVPVPQARRSRENLSAAAPADRPETRATDDSVHLGRQPVYDAALNVVGYELLFRRAGAVTADVDDPERATADVMVRTFADFGLESVVGRKLAFVNLPRHFLTGRHLLPFPSQQVVLEILEDVAADPAVLVGVQRLRAQGFRFALDDFVWSSNTEPLIELCDYVKLDVLAYSPAGLSEVVQRLRPYGVQLLAEKVETREQFEACRRLSFEYYQGYLLSRPTVLSRRSLDSTRLACLRLLSVLAADDYDLRDAEAAIRSDPGLTLRILRTVNSAAAGLQRKVSSVREAVLILGPRTLIGWVMLMSMSGGATGGNGGVNVDVALTRARMCELLASKHAAAAESAFTVGLVASLDLLLGMPLDLALADLPLDTAVLDAALHRSGPLGSLLADVLAYEGGQDPASVTTAEARSAYLAALAWTRAILARASS
jgi:EAL and modified HD-GYP domain-containing signal transduction protein